MAGTFMRRTSDLMRRVGTGKIEASVRVDQVYAQMQHQRADFKHPAGGKSHYLTDPLLRHFPGWYQGVAAKMYDVKMTTLFKDIADDFNDAMAHEAPKFLGDLARSGEARVKESGKFVYRNGPATRRLTKTQLRIKTAIWNRVYGDGRRH